MIRLLRDHFRRVTWFAVAGSLALLIDIGVLHLCQPWLGLYAGRVLSFLVAATFTWGFNRRFTFRANVGAPSFKEYGAYLGSMALGGLLNYAAYAMSVSLIDAVARTPAWGVAIGSLVGMSANYVSARRVIEGEP